jgi:hypothetical protein
MRVAVVMTTFNRKKLFQQTVESLRSCSLPFELVVVDNLSDDGTDEVIRNYQASGLIDAVVRPEKREACLYRTQLMGVDRVLHSDAIGGICLHGGGGVLPSLLLLTGDDYKYSPKWYQTLVEWYLFAPVDVAICTLDFEPEWDWNEVLGVVDAGGHRALVRRTAPGANWCLRLNDWIWIEKVYRELADDPLLDHKVCHYVAESRRLICALDLCEHAGALESLVANRAYSHAQPLDRQKWGV